MFDLARNYNFSPDPVPSSFASLLIIVLLHWNHVKRFIRHDNWTIIIRAIVSQENIIRFLCRYLNSPSYNVIILH